MKELETYVLYHKYDLIAKNFTLLRFFILILAKLPIYHPKVVYAQLSLTA